MINIKDIVNDPQQVINNLKKRNISKQLESDILRIPQLYNDEKNTKSELQDIRTRINVLSKSFFTASKTIDLANKAEDIKEELNELKETSKTKENLLKSYSLEIKNILDKIPNIPSHNVPYGNSSNDNTIIHQETYGNELIVKGLPHWELAKKYDIIDFELGNKITGAGFPVYKNKGAKLQRALINFFLDEAEKMGYKEILPPIIVNSESAYSTGQIPDKEGNMYQLKDENLYIIPTAEVPITNIYRNITLNEDTLPIKHVGYTPCFRRESGSWGKHVRGLNRLHQFDKVEIVTISLPNESYAMLEEMKNYVEFLIKKLELPYRVLNLCGGDLGFTSAFTYDIEVFSMSQGLWLEVSSISNFETYQTNRLQLKYVDGYKNKHLLHTLNGSAIALPRIIAALIEQNQYEGGINIPKALWEYTNFETIN